MRLQYMNIINATLGIKMVKYIGYNMLLFSPRLGRFRFKDYFLIAKPLKAK